MTFSILVSKQIILVVRTPGLFQPSVSSADLSARRQPRLSPSSPLLLCPEFLANLPPAMAKVYIVSFRSHDDAGLQSLSCSPKNMKSAISTAWDHGGPDFQSRSTSPLHKPKR